MLRMKNIKIPIGYAIFIPLILISFISLGYFILSNLSLNKYIVSLEGKLAYYTLTTDKLIAKAKDLSQNLSDRTVQRDLYQQRYNEEKNRMDNLSYQIIDIKDTVGDLEKLNQIDEELLMKYSKIYFLNENYSPESLIKIPSEYTYNTNKEYAFHSKAWFFLKTMLSDASASSTDLKIISAYRSFYTQGEVKSGYNMIYGTGANKFSADQGYSEHQLGTAVDLTTSKIGGSFTGFEKTEAYQWLLDNAYKYGFILSYPKDNSYYQFEPWHWRFVGRVLAAKLHQDGKSFYDLEQREIDLYRISFFD